MNRSEMITTLKFRFPVNALASWGRCSLRRLAEWCLEYAILSEEERTYGVISVQNPLTSAWEKMYPHGIGAYPYHCERAETHPNAMVYKTEDQRGWETMTDYQELRPGYYQHRGLK